MVPVNLSIASKDDLKLRLDGYSAKEIRKYKVARILREAYEQGGVLNQADVSQLIFKRNTPQLAADGIKSIRIQLRDGSVNQLWFNAAASCMPHCLQWGAPPPFD